MLDRNNVISLGLVVLIVGLAGFLWKQEFQNETRAIGARSLSSTPVNKIKQVDVYEGLTSEQQFKVSQGVHLFCTVKYHPTSCIHHLTTCGQPCFKFIKKENRKKILSDYKKALKKAKNSL